MNTAPFFCADFAALAASAERLLAERERSDPDSVAANRLTAEAADARLRVARALVAIYRAVVRREDLPELPAGDGEILSDLASTANAAAKRAQARPADTDLARHAACISAMARHHQPVPGASRTPNILFVHRLNQHVRAQRKLREAA